MAAEYNTSLYYVSTEVLENIPKLELSRKVRIRGVTTNDPILLMGANFLAQIPPRCVVLLDFVNQTLANRISRVLQSYGRFPTRSSENWICPDTLDMLVNQTRCNERGNSFEWKCKDGRWSWMDPDTHVPVSSVLQEVRRTVRCFLPRPPAQHRWVKAPFFGWFLWPVAGKPPPAYQLFRMFIKREMAYNQSLRREEEAMMEQRLNFFLSICNNVSFGRNLLHEAKKYLDLERRDAPLLFSMRWRQNLVFSTELERGSSSNETSPSCISDRHEAWTYLEAQLEHNFSSIKPLAPATFLSSIQQTLRDRHGIETMIEVKRMVVDRNAQERQLRAQWKDFAEEERSLYQNLSQCMQEDYEVLELLCSVDPLG